MPNFRNHIQQIAAYSSARDDFKGEASVFLDANENPFSNLFNRYPDPKQKLLKRILANEISLKEEQIFIGNGSDEAIDLIIRATCEPGKDSIAICPPTYGMYKVCAEINNVGVQEVALDSNFQLDEMTPAKLPQNCKLIFLCSPNNPTGNVLNKVAVEKLLAKQNLWVVVDEAYIHFSENSSWTNKLNEYSNLIVLQTLSKALGLAGLRVGMAFAQSYIINVLNTIKPPYNVNSYSQEKAVERLSTEKWKDQVNEIKEEKARLMDLLPQIDIVTKVFPSQANFLLCQFVNASKVYKQLLKKGIVVRDRSSLVPESLRITVGTKTENELLLNALKNI